MTEYRYWLVVKQTRFQRAVVRFDQTMGDIGPQILLSVCFIPMALGGLMLLSLLDDGFSFHVVIAGSALTLFGMSVLVLYIANGYQKFKMHNNHEHSSDRMKL